jgi:hypothetical protein
MEAAGIFSDADLRAIKRTFLTRKATPEEVCLVVQPRRLSAHMLTLLFPFVGILAIGFWLSIAPRIFEITVESGSLYELRDVLVDRFWAASAIVLLLLVVSFVLVPLAFLPRFEITVRPGSHVVTMRGLGVEQERLASCCLVINHYLWCTFSVDRIGYSLLRRWWQLPWPILKGATALERTFAPARAALSALVACGKGQEEMMDSARRFLWARSFGEAFLTGSEVVVVLPPAGWFVWPGALVGAGGLGSGILFWHAFHSLVWGHDGADGSLVWELSRVPIWAPSAIAILYTACVSLWADPWFRRAVAVIPRGLQRIRIQVGKRVRGEVWFHDWTIYVSDNRGSESMLDYLHVDTRFWSGTKWARRLEEFSLAEQELKKWAGLSAPAEGDQRG